MTELCAYHEHAAVQCLAKNGHHPDSDTAEMLRTDLARYACTPRFCRTATDTAVRAPRSTADQEKP